MASLKKSNLSKVKKQLLNRNIKTGGPLNFNPDASNKILVAAIVIAALVEGIAFAALFAVN